MPTNSKFDVNLIKFDINTYKVYSPFLEIKPQQASLQEEYVTILTILASANTKNENLSYLAIAKKLGFKTSTTISKLFKEPPTKDFKEKLYNYYHEHQEELTLEGIKAVEELQKYIGITWVTATQQTYQLAVPVAEVIPAVSTTLTSEKKPARKRKANQTTTKDTAKKSKATKPNQDSTEIILDEPRKELSDAIDDFITIKNSKEYLQYSHGKAAHVLIFLVELIIRKYFSLIFFSDKDIFKACLLFLNKSKHYNIHSTKSIYSSTPKTFHHQPLNILKNSDLIIFESTNNWQLSPKTWELLHDSFINPNTEQEAVALQDDQCSSLVTDDKKAATAAVNFKKYLTKFISDFFISLEGTVNLNKLGTKVPDNISDDIKNTLKSRSTVYTETELAPPKRIINKKSNRNVPLLQLCSQKTLDNSVNKLNNLQISFLNIPIHSAVLIELDEYNDQFRENCQDSDAALLKIYLYIMTADNTLFWNESNQDILFSYTTILRFYTHIFKGNLTNINDLNKNDDKIRLIYNIAAIRIVYEIRSRNIKFDHAKPSVEQAQLDFTKLKIYAEKNQQAINSDDNVIKDSKLGLQAARHFNYESRAKIERKSSKKTPYIIFTADDVTDLQHRITLELKDQFQTAYKAIINSKGAQQNNNFILTGHINMASIIRQLIRAYGVCDFHPAAIIQIIQYLEQNHLSNTTYIETVYDPCAGQGAPLIGFLASPSVKNIIVNDVNPELKHLYNEINRLFNPKGTKKVTIFNEQAELLTIETIQPACDLLLTSPPFYDKEKYLGEKQSLTLYPEWETWLNYFLFKLIDNCLNIVKPGGFIVFHLNQTIYETILAHIKNIEIIVYLQTLQYELKANAQVKNINKVMFEPVLVLRHVQKAVMPKPVFMQLEDSLNDERLPKENNPPIKANDHSPFRFFSPKPSLFSDCEVLTGLDATPTAIDYRM